MPVVAVKPILLFRRHNSFGQLFKFRERMLIFQFLTSHLEGKYSLTPFLLLFNVKRVQRMSKFDVFHELYFIRNQKINFNLTNIRAIEKKIIAK